MAKAKKLPSGNWRVQASKKVDGVLYRKSFTHAKRRQAELMAAEWIASTLTKKTENITLKLAYEKYIEIKSSVLSPTTIRAYKSMKKNSLQGIMDIKLESLTPAIIQSEINELSATAKPKYTRNVYGLLTAVLKTFHPDLSLKNITLPQKQKTDMYIPDDDDIKVLLKAVAETRLEVPVLLAAFGPMRRGEICALTSDDRDGNIITVNKSVVLGDDKKWHIKSPKTYSSYRNIEYPDFVIDKIKDIEGKITDMTPSAITDAFHKVLKKCGLPNFRFHDLRHYAVSTLHSINVPDKYIMARGGWATNYTMNNVYNHALKNKQNEYDIKISKHFNSVYN